MSETTVYIKGNPGFMPAIITKLGGGWIGRGRNIDEDVISFSLPEKMTLVEFKAVVGKEIVSDYHVLFFDDLPGKLPEEAPWKFVPGNSFKMSIWADTNSKLTATKPVDYSEGNKT